MPGFTYDLHGPAAITDRPAPTPPPPALADFTPNPITEDDERENPRWPAIVEGGPLVALCLEIRQEFNRTRCQDYSCGRCWNGGNL